MLKGAKPIGARAMTAAERVQKRALIGNDITERYEEAVTHINWRRRSAAEKSNLSWFSTYCVGVIADSSPDGHLPEALGEMEAASTISRCYCILMARGHGKTTLTEGTLAKAIATGDRRYGCTIGANLDGGKSMLDDIFRVFTSEKFVQDYPHIGFPLLYGLETSYKRRLTINGTACECNKTSTEIILPTVIGDDGNPLPTSGSVVKAFGFSAGIRGKKRGTLRPDIAALDDIQTDEDAANPETVLKNLDIIRKSILNLGGKKKIAVLMTATIIEPDDLAVKIMEDKAWKTTFFPAFIKWPTDWIKDPKDGLWAHYFELYDAENLAEKKHTGSLAFYKANRAKMDAGADVLSPMNFNRSDGHISAIQKLMDKLHEIGEAAFSCEMQMKPKEATMALNISAKDVLAKASPDVKRLSVPPGFSFVTAATDLNLSYALTTVIKAFKPDTSSVVIWTETYPSAIDGRLTGRAYYDAVYAKLVEYGRHLSAMLSDAGVSLDVWGIDCNGTPFDAVTDFAAASQRIEGVGIRARGMRGSAAIKFNPLTRARLKDAANGTVLVGDAREQAVRGAGRRWIWWDSDRYRESVHLALLAKPGAVGGEELFAAAGADVRVRERFAEQITNERLMFKRDLGDGRTDYRWKTKEPHDYLDADAMCSALAGHYGIGAARIAPQRTAPRRRFTTSVL